MQETNAVDANSKNIYVRAINYDSQASFLQIIYFYVIRKIPCNDWVQKRELLCFLYTHGNESLNSKA